MAGEVTIRKPAELLSFSQEKRDLIRSTIARNLPEPEFKLFMAFAAARGLDPVLNQIHGVMRTAADDEGNKKKHLVTQVAIDGFRLIASRTGEYAGSDEPLYDHNPDGLLTRAKVTVYRIVGGIRCPFVGIAYWDEFYPGDKQGFMWNKMPYNQLSKCAEAQALRKGFPGDLSGLYEPAELEREIVDVTPNKEETIKPNAFEDNKLRKEIKTVVEKYARIGVSEQDICLKYSFEDVFNLNEDQVKELYKIGASIKNGTTTAAKEFPPAKTF